MLETFITFSRFGLDVIKVFFCASAAIIKKERYYADPCSVIYRGSAVPCCGSAGCLDLFQIILAVPPRFFYDKILFCKKHPSETLICSVSHFAPINKRPIFVSRHFHKVSAFFNKKAAAQNHCAAALRVIILQRLRPQS